jgi:hypothetical protein
MPPLEGIFSRMKKALSFIVMVTAILSSGCVATTYSKSVSVSKDADGKILGTVETEQVVQPGGQGWPVKFEHLKGVQVGGQGSK